MLSLMVCGLLLNSSDARAEPRFETEILPLLTVAGCNAGSCHGSAAGRGGFKLSLFGSQPDADFDAIVRDLEGRRGLPSNTLSRSIGHNAQGPAVQLPFILPCDVSDG